MVSSDRIDLDSAALQAMRVLRMAASGLALPAELIRDLILSAVSEGVGGPHIAAAIAVGPRQGRHAVELAGAILRGGADS